MANLEGDLNTTSITKVLQILITKNPASTWLVSDGKNEKVIYFSTGGIRLYSSKGRRVSSLEEFLVYRKNLSREDLKRATKEVTEGRHGGLADVLERMEFMSRKELDDVVSELIYFELCDLVTWDNAIHEYYPGNAPPEIFDQKCPALFSGFDVKSIIEKVRVWNQEWINLKTILQSENFRPKLLKDIEECKSSGLHPIFQLLSQFIAARLRE